MNARRFPALAGHGRALLRDTRAAALVELALVLPFLLTLYIGGFVLEDAISRNRKVTAATRALADLAAQSASGVTSTSEINNELAAATQVMAPYAPTPSTLRLTEVYTDATLNTSVKWSKGLRTQGYAVSAPYTLPTALKLPGSYLLISEVTYAYTPPVTFGVLQARTISDRLIMLPRNTSSLDCGDC